LFTITDKNRAVEKHDATTSQAAKRVWSFVFRPVRADSDALPRTRSSPRMIINHFYQNYLTVYRRVYYLLMQFVHRLSSQRPLVSQLYSGKLPLVHYAEIKQKGSDISW